jgi:predicted DNA-binding transcriptional regulator YafY
MPITDHEVLAQRLTQIISKLNQGEALVPAALAEEFGVTLRTIQRDLNERLNFLPFEKADGRYRLHPSALGKLTLQDMRQFASMAGVQGLFPDLSHQFLRELFDSRIESAWLVKGPEYEDHSGREAVFAQLGQAITAHQGVSFVYSKAQLDGQPAPAKTYAPVHPYKLVNHGGIWYLAAEHEGKLKAFVLGKVYRLLVGADTFEPQAELLAMLQNEDSIWLNAKKSEVVLKVAKEAAIYFERRKLVGGQVIEKHLEDGGLIVSAQVAHPNQILPIVRYWIPHVRIISPEGLQGEMERGLLGYFG